MRRFFVSVLSFLSVLLFSLKLYADDPAPVAKNPEPVCLVNMAKDAVVTVNGSVNIVTGELVETAVQNATSGPDSYILGTSYAYRKPKEQAQNFVGNSVYVDGKLLVGFLNDDLRKKLAKFDIEPILLNMSEFKKAGGGIKCLTLYIS